MRSFFQFAFILFFLASCGNGELTDKNIMEIVDSYRKTEFRKATNTYDTPIATFLSRKKFEEVENQVMSLRIDILSKDNIENGKYRVRIFVSGSINESITTGVLKSHDIQRMYSFDVEKIDGEFELIEDSVRWLN